MVPASAGILLPFDNLTAPSMQLPASAQEFVRLTFFIPCLGQRFTSYSLTARNKGSSPPHPPPILLSPADISQACPIQSCSLYPRPAAAAQRSGSTSQSMAPADRLSIPTSPAISVPAFPHHTMRNCARVPSYRTSTTSPGRS